MRPFMPRSPGTRQTLSYLRDLFSANTEWVARTPLVIIELHKR